jgi:hypothetical protein
MQWLTSVMLAIWETEIRRTEFQGLSKQFLRLHLQNNQSKTDWIGGSRNIAPALQA